MVRLLRVCIGRIAAPLPHDESSLAVALKQTGQVTGHKNRRMARPRPRAVCGLPDTVTRRLRSTRGAVKNNSLENRSLLR
jgi:hypothetical protein